MIALDELTVNEQPRDVRVCSRRRRRRWLLDRPGVLSDSDVQEIFAVAFVDPIERLADVDFPLERSNQEAWLQFEGWRVNDEAAAYAIAKAIDAPPAVWSGPRRHPFPPIAAQRPATRRRGKPADGSPQRDD